MYNNIHKQFKYVTMQNECQWGRESHYQTISNLCPCNFKFNFTFLFIFISHNSSGGVESHYGLRKLDFRKPKLWNQHHFVLTYYFTLNDSARRTRDPNSSEMEKQINILKLHWLWFRHKHNATTHSDFTAHPAQASPFQQKSRQHSTCMKWVKNV